MLEIFKDAPDVSCSIQVTEFTIHDAYVLKLFKITEHGCLPSWYKNENDHLSFCHIFGEYCMELPQYNTIELYAKMYESCPYLPPTYDL
ncbi:hypothetical protein MKX01_020143 [Papaver californicum]|nr:hypothetical protein MKX01_020143 [Papaver californicum]